MFSTHCFPNFLTKPGSPLCLVIPSVTPVSSSDKDIDGPLSGLRFSSYMTVYVDNLMQIFHIADGLRWGDVIYSLI